MAYEYLVIALAALLVIGAIFLRQVRARRERQRQELAESAAAAREDVPDAEPPAPADPATLEIECLPDRFSLDANAARLSCRFTISNQSEAILLALRVSADMIAPHASRPGAEQLSGPDGDATQVTRIGRLEPAEGTVVAFELQLDRQAIAPLRQGRAELVLPLVRLRVVGAGIAPVIRHFAVGLPSPGGKLHPIRMEETSAPHTELASRRVE
jgi:HAMP domain-containing protein